MNCLWGRLGMRNNLPRTEIVKSRGELLKIINDEDKEVLGILPIDDTQLYVNWCDVDAGVTANPVTNVVLAAQTTALARLKLLSYLQKLGERVAYFDTDSVIYISRGDPDEYHPPLGNSLGQMTDELEVFGHGSYATEFVAAADKFYALKILAPDNSVHEICKVKGVSVNSSNAGFLNFDAIKSLVLNNETKTIKYSMIARTPLHDVLTKTQQEKKIKQVHTKRRYINLTESYPFGYKRQRF